MTKITEGGLIQDSNSTEKSKFVDINFINFPKDAEKVNGSQPMLSLIVLIGAIAKTGLNIPNIF